MTESSSILVRPAKNVSGSLRLPGDKSISHRYAMLAGAAEGPSHLENFSTGADCGSTVACMRALGVEIQRQDGNLEIHGLGPELKAAAGPLDCGNSGSTMRMLSGILAGQSFRSELIGDASLSRRPMERIVTPLSQMGASFSAAPGCRPPLQIEGARLRGIEYHMPIASAQVKSSLLFAGLLAEGETKIEEPLRTRDHGELALRAFGAEVSSAGTRSSLQGGQKLHGITAAIPGDISSAAFFICAAALFKESNLVIDALLLNPTRTTILDVLISMGVRISVMHVEEHHGELVGTVHVRSGGRLLGGRISGKQS